MSFRRPATLEPDAAFRLTLLLLCGVLSVLANTRTYASLPIALLAVLAVLGASSGTARGHLLGLPTLEASVTGVCVVLTGGTVSPLLPYLLAPPACAALARGARGAVVVSGVSATALLLVGVTAGPAATIGTTESLGRLASAGAEWVLLGLALGLLTARVAAQARGQRNPQEDAYGEARALLEQLQGVSRGLPGGLDEAASAQSLLERCADITPSERSAVLVQPSPGSLVPTAVRGTARLPWRDPLSEPGPLRDAWQSRLPVLDRRAADQHGRRRGSVLVVLPLLKGGEPFGLVVLESYSLDAFPPETVTQLAATVRAGSLRLETALLFAEVRSAVTVEERERLAREIHDGIAQDLASVGYQLDDLRLQAAKRDPVLAGEVATLRASMTGLIGDLRLSITDLRTSVASDRGLGSALSSHIRAIGRGQRLQVHLTLSESAFRLRADQEVLLFQVAHTVAQDVRKAGGVDNLWVHLTVEPPYARLVLEHDRAGADPLDLSAYREQMAGQGGHLTVEPRADGGVRVTAVLEGTRR